LFDGLLLLIRLPAERSADDYDGSGEETDYCIGSPSIHPSHLDWTWYAFMPERWRDTGVPVVIVRGRNRRPLATILGIET
jgi:hypothetical protein